jgi:hypothetical protein
MQLTAYLPTLTWLRASVNAYHPAHRDLREAHLKDRLLDISGHLLVALDELCNELALAVAGHFQALDLPVEVTRVRW